MDIQTLQNNSLSCAFIKISSWQYAWYSIEFSCGPTIYPGGKEILFKIICGMQIVYGLTIEKAQSSSI